MVGGVTRVKQIGCTHAYVLTKEDKCEQKHQAEGQPCVAESVDRKAQSTEGRPSADVMKSFARCSSQQAEVSTPSPAVLPSLSCLWSLNEPVKVLFTGKVTDSK